MNPDPPETGPMKTPLSALERTLIDEYIRARGVDPDKLHELPPERVKQLMIEATTHAAARLAEVESRAHYIDDIHEH